MTFAYYQWQSFPGFRVALFYLNSHFLSYVHTYTHTLASFNRQKSYQMFISCALLISMLRTVLKWLKPLHLDVLFLTSCSPLYNEVICLCLDLRELDAAIAIVAEIETSGITVSDETLDRVISGRRASDTAATTDDASSSQ